MGRPFGEHSRAISEGKSHYFTGKPCKHGHVSVRYQWGGCVECERLKDEKGRLLRRRRGSLPGARAHAKQAGYKSYLSHRPCPRGHVGKRETGSGSCVECRSIYRVFHENKRKSARLKRTPQWADLKQIEAFYTVAAALSKRDGFDYNVDHVIPLQGKLVSGLHVHYNLAVIPADENMRKHNKFIVE